jgi:predicted transcriptional regulator
MKTVSFKIGIRPIEETLNEVKDTLKKISADEKVEQKEYTVYFPDFSTMKKILTDERIRILKEIKHNHFNSIYELTKALNRDSKNVHDDVKYLANMGLIKLSSTTEGRKKSVPTIEYDKIYFEVIL